MISNYQRTRELIPEFDDYKSFQMMISDAREINFISQNEKKGLVREWRAYYYLVARFPNNKILISDAKSDKIGIDLIMMHSGQTIDAGTKIQVGMVNPFKKQLAKNIDIYMQVLDDRSKPIYYIKNKKT